MSEASTRTGGDAPLVAIVGRPNVGKSTLFNRLVGSRQAIVEDHPGVTRDRLYGTASWAGQQFLVVDTGGIDPTLETGMPAHIKAQVDVAVEEADLLLLVVDVLEGITAVDLHRIAVLGDPHPFDGDDHPGRGLLARDEGAHPVGHAVGVLGADDDMEQRRRDIVDAVVRTDTGNGVILLTDMFGGTPSNLAISIMEGAPVEVLAGVNLPMLVKLVSVRGDMPLAEAVRAAGDAGRKYISVASEVLSGQ